MYLHVKSIPNDYDPEIEKGSEALPTYRADLATIASVIAQIVNAEDARSIKISKSPIEVSPDIIERSIQALDGIIKGVEIFKSNTGYDGLRLNHHNQIVYEAAVALGHAFRANPELIPLLSGAVLQVVFMPIDSPQQSGEPREVYPGFIAPINKGSKYSFISSFVLMLNVPGTNNNLIRVGVGFSIDFVRRNYPPKRR